MHALDGLFGSGGAGDEWEVERADQCPAAACGAGDYAGWVATPPLTQEQVQKMELDDARMKAQLEDWAQLGRYRAADLALPAMEPGRVVFYGDSITDAWV